LDSRKLSALAIGCAAPAKLDFLREMRENRSMASHASKIIFNESQLDLVQKMAEIRLPHWQMASLLGLSVNMFQEVVRRDDAVQNRLMLGRSKGSELIRRTLFQMAVGERDPDDPAKWVHKPCPQALKFWCISQEGFKSESQIDVNIVDHQIEMTSTERNDEIKRLLALTALIDASSDS